MHATSSHSLVLGLLALLVAHASAQQGTWERVGNGNYTSFVVSPDYAQDGKVWAALTLFPTVSQTRIELSSDRGDTFAVQSQITNSVHIRELAISPTFASDHTLYQSHFRTGLVTDELLRSTDGGATWVSANLPSAGQLRAIRLSPDHANDQTLFANRVTYDRAYRSTNGGQSWSIPTQGPLPLAGTWDVEFAPDFASSAVVHLWHPVYNTMSRSTDGGATFTTCPGTCGASFPYDIEAAPFGPGTQRIVFAAGEGGSPWSPAPGLYRSIDNGLHYSVADTGLPIGTIVHRVETSPDFAVSGRVYLATDHGVWFSNDHGGSYSPLPAVGLGGANVVDVQLAGGGDGDLYVRVANSVVGTGDLYRLRLSGTGALDLGHALAGANGEPQLWGSAPFASPNLFDLRVADALGNGIGVHALGLGRVDLPFATGTLVPDPSILLVVLTDAVGACTTRLQWPANAAPGARIYAQTWLLDSVGAAGFASSNAIELIRL